MRELVTVARDPETGQANLERVIQEWNAGFPEESEFEIQRILSQFLLDFRFLDRYIEIIIASDIGSNAWNDGSQLVYNAARDRSSDFTAHPKYLELAETAGLITLWEQRGPPDHCKKLDGQWACE